MNRIKLLPDHVANQIAAGEVVERPSSVVKELVENSVDAEATRITVEIGAGGRSLIRVTDDGFGMSRDDVLMCLERHATSKLRRAEDLAAIATMGFRGEAMPSIASVSRFSLTSREREDTTGEATQVIINGGKIQEVKAAAGATGTTVEVRQLFYNLPARRKFLRAEETERAHIQHYLTLAALANPQVAFTLVSDQRPLWQFPGIPVNHDGSQTAALLERWNQLYGRDTPMLRVQFVGRMESWSASDSDSGPERDLAEIRVWGWIGAPGVARSSRDEQHLFVNRRPIENRGLNFALIEGYHTVLMKGRYPVCCLFLEIDPAAVDVNIHPAKREVKFREEAQVRRLVAQAIRETLLKFHSKPVLPEAPCGSDLQLVANQSTTQIPEQTALALGFNRTTASAQGSDPTMDSSAGSDPTDRRLGSKGSVPCDDKVSVPAATGSVPAAGGENKGSDPNARVTSPGSWTGADRPGISLAPGGAIPLLQVPLRLLGVIGKLYVILESDRGLVLMDQHAAHERILFEQMLSRLERSENAPSQRLLLPETIELPSRDTDFLKSHLDDLGRMGIGLTEFGERTFLLDAIPPIVKVVSPKTFVLTLIDELKAVGTGMNNLRLGEDVIAKTVCRHSVKANDSLAPAELENLVKDLRRCQMPYTCPHGRPTLIEMSWRELEKKFGRVG